MARADLILDLIKNSFAGNKYQFKKVVEAMIAEERSKQHLQLADKLQMELDAMLRSAEKDIQPDALLSLIIFCRRLLYVNRLTTWFFLRMLRK